MSKKLTKEEILISIRNKIDELNNKYGNNYSLIRIVNINDTVDKIYLIIKNNKYGVEKEIQYSKFLIKERPFISNNEERLDILKNKYLENINTRLKELNNPNIEFIGFKDGDCITENNPWLKLKNIKYNETGFTRYKHFMENEWHCQSELREIRINKCNIFETYSEETAKSIILKKIEELKSKGKNYEFLGFSETYSGWDSTEIILKDKISEEIKSIRYSSFRKHGGWSNKFERLRISEEEIIKRIEQKIFQINLQNKIKFIGFENGTWSGVETGKLIFKNIKDDEEFLIKYHSFIENGCSAGNTISIYENSCKEILNKIGIDFKQHVPIKDFSKILCCQNTIYPDFYVDSINSYIEYDGKQHYQFTPIFQNSYQDFINQVNRDNTLVQYCKENNIKLLRISYLDNDRLEEVIHAFIIEGKDITTHIQPKLLPALIYD